MNSTALKDFQKWAQRPDAKAKEATTQTNAWTAFTKQFPNADKTQFVAQINIDEQRNITAEMFFKAGKGSLQSVFGSDRRYWSQKLNENGTWSGRNDRLSVSVVADENQKSALHPTSRFHRSGAKPEKIFGEPLNIYVTPDTFFVTKLREIFQQTKFRHYTATESKRWLGGPYMKYWPQQLNFAVFYATQGCGISREIFDRGLSLPPQIRELYKFHVYFTVRRILYQLGGIQNISALPDDPTFDKSSNHYDVASYKRICDELGIDPSSDFRFTHGKNHGLGSVYIGVTGHGTMKTGAAYPGGFYKFSDEGWAAKNGYLLSFIEPDAVPQYDWFAPNKSFGLTQAGLARINQSIEAFVYCILGVQVNVRSSILGQGGRAKETRSEFLVLMEDTIRQPDLAKSVQRYQLAVDEAKVRLNLAVCPGGWLMPARMIINTESTVGYNNKLKQAVAGMKLWVNNEVKAGHKKAALKLMAGGPSKINPPNNHPSNPIHKAAMASKQASHSQTNRSLKKRRPRDKRSPRLARQVSRMQLANTKSTKQW